MEINTAIILAGGFGTRLKPLVADVPKPMALVNGLPFLNYQVKFLKHFGIQHIIFSVGYKYDAVMQYFGNSFHDLRIEYAIEEQALGTGGGIRLAMEKCSAKDCLVLNGDSYFDFDLNNFIQQYFKNLSKASIAVRHVEDASRFGTIELNSSNGINSFKEKSGLHQAGQINAGIYLLNKNFFITQTPTHSAFSIEKDFFESSAVMPHLHGYVYDGYFIDIGLPQDYIKAQDDFKAFRY